jgi:hypothetical protein
MTPQLSVQQMEHATRNLEKRVKAKTLECVSLDQMRKVADTFLDAIFDPRDKEKQQPVQDAVHNFLTAKMNYALVDLEELELTLRAYKQMSSPIVGASLIPPNSRQH